MDNQRRYDAALPKLIEKGVTFDEQDGLRLELRPVPDDSRLHALDPRVVELFELRKSGAFPTPKGDDLISMRSRPNKESYQLDGGGVRERVIPMDLPGRTIYLFVFTPQNLVSGRPCLAYFHGGGFTVGNISQFRNPLRLLAEKSGCVVVFPEYRLAPECPFPGPVMDCNDTVEWVAQHADELGIDASRIAVAGDSAGGSLANAVVILQRDSGRIKLAVELYPCVDAGPVPLEWSHDMYPCLPEQEEAALSRVDRILKASDGMSALYLEGRSALCFDPLVSALFYARLGEFPRTIVVSSEFDYLRYQDELFARKLKEAGASVRAIRYLGCDHGFFETCGVMPQVEDLVNVISGELGAL